MLSQYNSSIPSTLLTLICYLNTFSTTFLNLDNKMISQAPIGRICQFPWYQYSHQGWFQATKMISLNTNLGRDASRAPFPYRFHGGGDIWTWGLKNGYIFIEGSGGKGIPGKRYTLSQSKIEKPFWHRGTEGAWEDIESTSCPDEENLESDLEGL